MIDKQQELEDEIRKARERIPKAMRGLKVGARVEIVASERIASCYVGLRGEIERLTKPFWMARVRLDDYPDLFTCWVEKLRVLPLEALEEMGAEQKVGA